MKLLNITILTFIAASFVNAAEFRDSSYNWNKSSSSSPGKVALYKGVHSVAGISRNQNTKATIDPAFAKTSRPCPPFCIQPMRPFKPAQVETIGEREIIDAAARVASGDKSLLLVDSRTPGWVKRGTIPHSINVPFTKLNAKAVAKDPDAVAEILTDTFGASEQDGIWNFNNAKTLYLFCNGMWCGQSPASIRALLAVGYPEQKIKYYRGGMQDWKILGLTTK